MSGSEFFSAFLGKFAFTKPTLLSFLLRVAPGFCVGPGARRRARGPPTRRRSVEEGQGPYARGAGGPSACVIDMTELYDNTVGKVQFGDMTKVHRRFRTKKCIFSREF